MKLPSALAVVPFSVMGLLWQGCACPKRNAETSHSVEWFRDRQDGLVRREV